MSETKFQFLMVQLKAFSFNANNINDMLFQFLMVQLKAWRKCLCSRCETVSIPYGTIKSERTWLSALLSILVSIPYGTIKSILKFL